MIMALDKRIENIEAALMPEECPKCTSLREISDVQLDAELKELRRQQMAELSVAELDAEIDFLVALKNEKIIKGSSGE
jgi:hypothetical protein